MTDRAAKQPKDQPQEQPKEQAQDQPKEKPKAKSQKAVDQAIAAGKDAITNGKTKVEAVRIMYPMIKDEPREVIWATFQAGAGLTEKGSVTYLYNVIRDSKKDKKGKAPPSE